MDAAGGKSWEAHKAAALLAGVPVLPGEELEATLISSRVDRAAADPAKAPNWEEFKKLHPEAAERKPKPSKSSAEKPAEAPPAP